MSAALAAALVGGCSSATSTPAATKPASVDPATELFGRLASANAKLRTAHVVENLTADNLKKRAALRFDGTGDIAFSAGKVTAADLEISRPDDGAQVAEGILADNAFYVRQTGHNGPGGKPWVKLTSNTPAEYRSVVVVVVFADLLSAASPSTLISFRPGATEVRKRLATTQAGVAVTPFALGVELSKVAALPTYLRELADPTGALNVAVNIDSNGRPVSVSHYQPGTDAHFDSLATYSKYDAPVTVAAPPASEVGG